MRQVGRRAILSGPARGAWAVGAVEDLGAGWWIC